MSHFRKISAKFKRVCSIIIAIALIAPILPISLSASAEAAPPDESAWAPYTDYLNSDTPKKEDMRATWIVTVYNSDWPSSNSVKITDVEERVRVQKEELCNILDAAVSSNLNAVMFQVRTASDALYESDKVPWSKVLTGDTGKEPGFDPLKFAIEEAHKRGLELHAWFNPYRAATAVGNDEIETLKKLPKSVFNTHFGWIKKCYDGVYTVDPGIPEVREWVEDCVMEVVEKYDIDGVHFDDYFYHEGKAYDYDDKATFEMYDNGFTDRGDWRRNNTYKLIDELSQKIKDKKPWVQFGISPAGMWGNMKDGHPNGSPTAGGAPNYDRAFVDTLRWANEGLIDYICPQVYWPFGRDVAPYGVIAAWWANNVTNPNTKIYIGMGLYRVNGTSNPTETGFLDPYAKDEIIREIQLNTNYKSNITNHGIDGSFLYQSSNIIPSTGSYKREAVENGVRTAWANKAIAPCSTWKSNVKPAMPTNINKEKVEDGTKVTWESENSLGIDAYYAIYRFRKDEGIDITDPTKLIAVVGSDIKGYIDTSTEDPSEVEYVVTALDRLHNESSPDAQGTGTPASSIGVNITTAAGVYPKLPASVTVYMDTGEIANMMVKWDKIEDADSYAEAGNKFDVSGTVINPNGIPTSVTVKAHVSVAEPTIEYICPCLVKTEEKSAPVFPDTVDVIYTDGTVSSLPVTWETPNAKDYENAAPFNDFTNPSVKWIKGTVDGTQLKAEGNFIVYPSVESYEEVNIKTREGIPPMLPTSVNVTYTDGTKESVEVKWDEVPPEAYKEVGSFKVYGTIEGSKIKVEANVTVERLAQIVDVEDIYVKTGIGVAPKLPSTVLVTYDDGTKEVLPVTWPEIDPKDKCGSTRRFTVAGTIDGTETSVTATVEVAAVIVLDDFEGGKVVDGVAKSMINWTGDSVSSTPPTLSYDTNIKKSGESSLRFDYTLSKVGGTASAYSRPNVGKGIVFNPGEVPQKIGFWVYGNGVKTFSLRAEFRSGITTSATNTNQNINGALDFVGWRYMEYTVDPSYQTTGLCITLMPGIVATSAGDKVDSTIYIDDLVAVYGSETKDVTEINNAIETAQDIYNSTSEGTGHGQYPQKERQGLKSSIDAVISIRDNESSTIQDIYDATDLLNSAVEAYRNTEIIKERHQIIDDYEDHGDGKSNVQWNADSASGTPPKLSYNTEPQYVKDGNRSFRIDYNFEGTKGTASAYVKGAGYPNPALKFTGEDTPNKIGFWLYGNDKPIFSLRAEGRKSDGSSAKTLNFIKDSVMKSGWNFVTCDISEVGLDKTTGLLINIMPGLVEISDSGRVNSTIYIDDLTVIYNIEQVPTINKTALIGNIGTAKSLLIGAVEGDKGGQYPEGSIAKLTTALETAQPFMPSTVQEDIDNAAANLSNAVNAFKDAQIPLLDKPGLLSKITSAEEKLNAAVEGDKPGEYREGAKETLKNAIDAAKAVYDNGSATKEIIEDAKAALSKAVEEFDSKVVPPLDTKALDDAIDLANRLYAGAIAGTEPGQYPQKSIDDFKAAIAAAKASKVNAVIQKDIDDALDNLNNAIKAFEDTMVPLEVGKALLDTAIKDAKSKVDSTTVGTLGGQYPKAAKDAVLLALSEAKKVLDDIHATQEEIDAAVVTLNEEVEKYIKTRIPAPWDKYNIPDKTPINKREMRAAWVSTVVNIDWPSTETWDIEDSDLRAKRQKEDLIEIFDYLESAGCNAVMFQVRPSSDTLYKSEIAPWSYWLTGKQNVDPGFDPLQFAIDEAHKRNLELHAWVNPYRVSMPASFYKDETGKTLSNLTEVGEMLNKVPNSVYKEHPDWVKVAGNRFVLDPGIPAAREYVEDCVMEIVNNYDVDGIHFDDYFYIGSVGGFDKGYGDQLTYDTYADKAKFSKIEDWRRDNTYTLMSNLHNKINEVKPWVKFGVSPAGVWGNKKDGHLDGSDTNAGIPNYDRAYADTKKWVLDEIIDYICPQVYWTFANSAAPYGVVSSWWSDLLKANPDVRTQLYIGVGLYWLNPDDEVSSDPYWNTLGVGDQEIARQLRLNAANPNIDGTVIFTYNSFRANYPNAISAADLIKNDLWASKALVPAMLWKGGVVPKAPVITDMVNGENGNTITWDDNDKNTTYYAVYRFEGNEAVNIDNPNKLIAKVRKDGKSVQSYTDAKGNKKDKYVVTTLNRLSDESLPSNESTDIGGWYDDGETPGGEVVYNKERLAGKDRFDTSKVIAEKLNTGKVKNVVLVTGENYPDALCGSVLAKSLDAPILLGGLNSKDNEAALEYIKNHLEKDGTVYILGGEEALPPQIETQIKGLGFNNIKRLSGKDRYDTCKLVTKELNVKEGTPVIIATGESFADALSISSIAAIKGYPVLLTNRNFVPKGTKEMLNAIKPSEVIILGGKDAVSYDVEKQIKSITNLKDDSISRLWGKDRYETCINIAKHFKLDGDTICFATGLDYPDALAGSIIAAKLNAPIILIGKDVSTQTKYLDSIKYKNQIIFGGENAIPSSIEKLFIK